MDLTLLFEMFEDPAHRHVLLNHWPIVGLCVAWLVLAGALYEARWTSIVFALVLVALLSGSSVLVSSAGDAAYPAVFDALDGPGQDWLDHHALLAERWGWILPLNAALAVAALGLGGWREAFRQRSGLVVLASTFAALVAAVVIAQAGGQIRHPEFRLSDPPEIEGPGRIR